jgi:hypothetical protein
MDRKLKRLFAVYIAAATGCAIVVCLGILADRYAASLNETFDTYQTLKINKANMKHSIKAIEAATARLRAEIPRDFSREAVESSILLTFDDLKSRLKGYQVSIGSLERKEAEIALPVTIQGILTDYRVFLNNLGALQALNFPFFAISKVSFGKSEETAKGRKDKPMPVLFEIKGALTMQTHLPGAGQ